MTVHLVVLGVLIENSSDLAVCFPSQSISMALTSKKIEEFSLMP